MQAVIDQLGYESSLVARSLRSRRTNVIGILVADIEPFSAELLKGAGARDPRHGYELIVFSGCGRGEDQLGWERRYARGSAARSPTGHPRHADGRRRRRRAPLVAVDHNAGPSTTCRASTPDNLRRRSPRPST